MEKSKNVPVRERTQRRLKLEAARQGRSIVDLASEVLSNYLNGRTQFALSGPNIHDVARDSDPIDGGDHQWLQP